MRRPAVRLFLLTKYGDSVASSRIRWIDHLAYFERLGFVVSCRPLHRWPLRYGPADVGRPGRHLPLALAWLAVNVVRRLFVLTRLRRGDIVVLQKAVVPAIEIPLLRRARKRGASIIMDIDDSEYVLGSRRARDLVRVARLSSVAIGGSESLFQWLQEIGAPDARLIPTPVPAGESPTHGERPMAILWTGSPASASNLLLLVEPLDDLKRLLPSLEFFVLGCGPTQDLPEWWSRLNWSAAKERELLRVARVGVMPLLDTPMNGGKCGYKALLYAAWNVRVVASPIGANSGLLAAGLGAPARTSADWVRELKRGLLEYGTPEYQAAVGRAKTLVDRDYGIDQYRAAVRSAIEDLVPPRP